MNASELPSWRRAALKLTGLALDRFSAVISRSNGHTDDAAPNRDAVRNADLRPAATPSSKSPLRTSLVLLLAASAPSQAASLNDWASRQAVDVRTPGLVRVALPSETFDAAQSTLADLRLLDSANVEVPFLIEQPRPRARTLRPQEGWQVFIENNRTRVEVDVNLRGRLTAFTIETPAPDFLKAASLTGTENGRTRSLFTGYPIFRQPRGATQLQFKLPEGTWTHLTLLLDDTRSRPVPITGIVLHDEDPVASPPEVEASRLGERVEASGETRIAIDLGAARIPLASLRIRTEEPLFIRRANVLAREFANGEVRERSLGGGTIYRVAVEGQTNAAQIEVMLDAQSPGRELVLAIDNGDSPPLSIEAVEVLRRSTHLVFFTRQPGLFHLFSGNPRATAPRYDVASLSSQLRSAKVSLAKLGALNPNPEFRPSEPLPEISLFAAPLDVKPWSFRRAVKTGASAVQQLELTPHVLAHAQPGLGDLRLVAAGKQVPFILERAGFTRVLNPEVSRADDPERPTLSRWTIRLPQARLPIPQLSCETRSTLFQREARVLEEVPNSRGERYTRALGNASWLRRPENKSGRLNIALTSPPQTETLLLEIDNGDNPPLELEKFQASLPVVRVLFKAPPGVATELCYGNTKAVPPSYDLDLVAPQILAAAKTEATLVDPDPTGPSRPRSSDRKISYLFFGVLALVVAGLVVVITRLLPKPSKP